MGIDFFKSTRLPSSNIGDEQYYKFSFKGKREKLERAIEKVKADIEAREDIWWGKFQKGSYGDEYIGKPNTNGFIVHFKDLDSHFLPERVYFALKMISDKKWEGNGEFSRVADFGQDGGPEPNRKRVISVLNIFKKHGIKCKT